MNPLYATSREAQEDLAQQLEQHWHSRGFPSVKFWVAAKIVGISRRVRIWVLRSNLNSGLPPEVWSEGLPYFVEHVEISSALRENYTVRMPVLRLDEKRIAQREAFESVCLPSLRSNAPDAAGRSELSADRPEAEAQGSHDSYSRAAVH